MRNQSITRIANALAKIQAKQQVLGQMRETWAQEAAAMTVEQIAEADSIQAELLAEGANDEGGNLCAVLDRPAE